MKDTPFDTIGDEPVEARIVAWVLGEASAFEAAELERLCEERPELLVFRRRMRTLHGLLTEAEAAEPDHSWKLPAEKRKALDEIFGEETVVWLDARKELRVRRHGRRAMLAIAACVAITFFITRLTPWKHEAEAIIEVKPRSMGISPLGGGSAGASSSNPFTPQFFGTEFEKIKSRNSLEKVVENLDLPQRWDMDKESAIKRVKDSIETRNVPGTDLLSIKVRDASERDAREITHEVVRAYKQYRSSIEQKEADKSLAELNKAVRDQEDKVEERRKVLATIVRTKGIIYKGQDSFYGQSGVDEDQGARSAGEKSDAREDAIKRGLDAQDYVDAKREFETDQQLLQSMKLKQIDETISKKMAEDSVVVHEMTPPLESEKSVAFHAAPAASGGKSEIAFKLDSAAKESDESLARNGTGSLSFGPEIQKPKSAASQLSAPAAAPAAPPVGTGKSDSFAMSSNRQAGRKENARQLQPAKQPAVPQSRVFAEGALSTPALDAPSEIEALPQITERSGLGGDVDGFRDARARVVPPSTETAAAAAEPEEAQLLAKDSSPAKKEKESRSEFRSDSYGLSLGDRLDTDVVVAGTVVDGIPMDPNQLGLNGVTRGLRSGDQAINRNSIDAILNNPDRFSAGASAGKGIKAGSDAIPPALADRESTFTAVPGQATIVSGVRMPLGATVGNLAEGGEKSGAGGPLENDSSTTAGQEGRLAQGNWGGVTTEPAQAVDQVRRNLYTAEGNYNLGKYDDAKLSYQDTLKIDPYNSAARRGLEKVEAAKSDYYRAAYDHTRAELLSQVDSAWELSVPADGKNREFEGVVNYGSPIQDEQSKNQGAAADPFAEAKAPLGDGLAGANTYTGATTVSGGTLALGDTGVVLAAPARPTQQKLVDLMEEIPATENPYSTFSLNISDASFQLAKAALAKGERPDPESIKPEQFYNAVDYGDPAPSSNESVAATVEQSAHPVIPGRNLVRVALRTGSAGRSAAQPLRLTLLVDQSGSMVREDRRASMEHALAQLGVLLTKADLVTVIGFSRTPHLLAEAMTGDDAGKLGDLVNQTASEGGTNLEEAMKLGADKALRHQLAGAQNRIVLFTDGAANLGDANPERLAAQVKALRQKGIAFDIAGIGADGLNDRLLSELARNGNGRYYVVGSENNDSFARQLAGAFRPAAENVKVQVNFNPQRVGKYKLIGFEKDRLKTEDFRNDAVDAAELAAEEAGVAIYQVEPLAEGTGELGEVSVRFRDAASGQMVERAWTIPYAAQAIAFDRATPSMQLAGLSLLAAEKLKGGPLADAIDFKQLTGSSAFVKQFYGSSPRVSDMLQVIEKLK